MTYRITSPGIQSFIVESDIHLKKLIKQMESDDRLFFPFIMAGETIYLGIGLLKSSFIQEVDFKNSI